MTLTGPLTVVGSLNVDVVVRAPALPRPGETLLGTSVTRLPGGKGANQAVALAGLGVDVALVGAVGDDADGALCLASLPGVDVSGVRRVAVPTGLALIQVDDAGENTIVVVPGANALAEAPAVVGDLLAQLEVPLDVVAESVRRATGLVVLNAAPAAALPVELLAQVDVLVVNESEAALLPADPEVRQGVVVTLGARGAVVTSADGTRTTVPSPVVAAVDTVGAGDAFVGALVAALLEGRDLVEAARHGCAAGAIAVTRPGARSAPTRDELRSALA